MLNANRTSSVGDTHVRFGSPPAYTPRHTYMPAAGDIAAPNLYVGMLDQYVAPSGHEDSKATRDDKVVVKPTRRETEAAEKKRLEHSTNKRALREVARRLDQECIAFLQQLEPEHWQSNPKFERIKAALKAVDQDTGKRHVVSLRGSCLCLASDGFRVMVNRWTSGVFYFHMKVGTVIKTSGRRLQLLQGWRYPLLRSEVEAALDALHGELQSEKLQPSLSEKRRLAAVTLLSVVCPPAGLISYAIVYAVGKAEQNKGWAALAESHAATRPDECADAESAIV